MVIQGQTRSHTVAVYH